MSRIITFYSYKGGVGRTFALANIAVLLAKRGKRVLLMDWDLEAPGLHRYFKPYLEHTFLGRDGLVHLLGNAEANSQVSWQSYITKVAIPDCKQIHLIASGDQAPDYVERVRNFSWSIFFEKNAGGDLLNRWRNEWKEHYDFVLVDSRTGITDTGGVCTIYLPDILVLVFSANNQSFERGVQVASGVQQARRNLAVPRPPLAVLPLPGRFDGRDEVDEAQFWLNRFAEELKPFYDDWLPKGLKPRQILELTKVPYVTKFSFGEPLPVITQGTTDPEFPGFYLENVTRLLSSDFADAQSILSGGPSGLEALIANFRSQLAQVPIDEVSLNQTVAQIEVELGNDPRFSDLLREAGIALLRQSRFDASESCLRRSLTLAEQHLGPNHPSTVSGLIHLAELLEITKRLSEAEALYRRTLEVVEEAHTVEDGVAATVYNRLAAVLRESGRIPEAELMYRRSLELLEMNNTGDPVVANSYSNLGTIYRETGRWVEAEAMYRRALELLERTAGPSDPAIADAYSNLAAVLRQTRRLEEAEKMYRRALEMLEITSNRGGAAVTNARSNLASLFRETGRLDEAEHLYLRMLEEVKSTARRGDPAIVMAYNQLASLYRETGRKEEAEHCYLRMLEMVESTARRGDPAIVMAYNQLASLYRETGRLDEAEQLYRRILKELELTSSRKSPEIGVALNRLAEVLIADGRIREAEPLLRRSLDVFEATLDRDNPEAVKAREHLAAILDERSDFEEAKDLRKQGGFDAFISYSSTDRPLVNQLVRELEARRVSVWTPERELVPGQPFQPAIERAIENSSSIIVCIGESGLGPWQGKEIVAAMQFGEATKRRIIPVLLGGKASRHMLPNVLQDRVLVDLRNGLSDQVVDQLVWGITGRKTGS
jgi:tetratricopeptide (TPR) repeat protein/MinD-like ATPase involved in chromosome partitioning or flagellar assembly